MRQLSVDGYDPDTVHGGHTKLTAELKKELDKASIHGNHYSDRTNYLRMKHYPSTPKYPSDYTIEVPKNLKLKFESRFESGNLHKAIMISNNEYYLLLENDTNTSTYAQWFHFYVENTEPIDVTFHIINLEKNASLYSDGLMPLVYSTAKNLKENLEWHRAGIRISYTQTNNYKEMIDKQGHRYMNGNYYTLKFTYRFEYPDDRVYFAHSYPYTYSNLQDYLLKVKQHKDIARVDTLCYTLANNSCDVITITDNINSYISHDTEKLQWRVTAAARRLLIRKEDFKEYKEEHGNKKVVIFTSRVHPGETVASYIIQGTIDFLLTDSREAKLLRKNFIFKIVPMLNPDGVRYGNYRCSLLGVDLNRRWINPHKILHPTIYYTKKMILTLAERHSIAMYCDIHGHSRKKDVFMYGCGLKAGDVDDRRNNILAKMVPLLFSQRTSLFSFKDSHFRMEKAKESTARIVLYKAGIVNSYTLESTFYGPTDSAALGEGYPDGHMHKYHFNIIGKELAKVTQTFINQAHLIKKLMYATKVLRSSNTPCKMKKTTVKEFKSVRSGDNEIEDEGDNGKKNLESDYTTRRTDLEIEIENEIEDEEDEDVINSCLLDELEKQEEAGEGNEDTSSCSGTSDHSEIELEDEVSPIAEKPNVMIAKDTPPLMFNKFRSLHKRNSDKNASFSPTRANFQVKRHSTEKLAALNRYEQPSETPEKKTFRSSSSVTLKKDSLKLPKNNAKLVDYNNIKVIKEKLLKIAPSQSSKLNSIPSPWPKKSQQLKFNLRRIHQIDNQVEVTGERMIFTPTKYIDSKFISSYSSLNNTQKNTKTRCFVQDSSFLSVNSVSTTKSKTTKSLQSNKYKNYRLLSTPTVEDVYAIQQGTKFAMHTKESKGEYTVFKPEVISFVSNKDSLKKQSYNKYVAAGINRLHR